MKHDISVKTVLLQVIKNVVHHKSALDIKGTYVILELKPDRTGNTVCFTLYQPYNIGDQSLTCNIFKDTPDILS